MPVYSIALSQMQNPAFSFTELHATDDCSVLQFIQIPLQGPSSCDASTEVMQGIFGTGQEMGINLGLLLYLIGKRPAEGKKLHLGSFEACAAFTDLCLQVFLL